MPTCSANESGAAALRLGLPHRQRYLASTNSLRAGGAPPGLPGGRYDSLARRGHLGQQFIDRCVHFGGMDVPVAYDTFGIDQVDRWPQLNLPLGMNGAVDRPVPPASPIDCLLHQRLLEPFSVRIAVNAQQNERFARMPSHERPLVGIKLPAGASPVAPKGQHDDLAAVVAELKRLTSDILTLDLGRLFADGEVCRRR